MMKKILLCGHRSFAAQGLKEKLEECGHDIVLFSRGPDAKVGNLVTGPVMDINKNTYLTESFDVVINYIMLFDESVEQNRKFMKSLMQFCDLRAVGHLIHISSCSVYKNSEKNVDESTKIEKDPLKKADYGANKAAQEDAIMQYRPAGLKITIVRPGLILANGRPGNIDGIAFRLPWNSLLGLGNSKSQIPLISLDAVNDSIVKLVNTSPEKDVESLLLADSQSPTRRQYLEFLREIMGVGTRIHFFPVFLWMTAALFAEFLLRIIGRKDIRLFGGIRSVCRFQRFNSERSEKRLGIHFSADWKEVIFKSFDDQKRNYTIPVVPQLSRKTSAKKINYIGFGRIVKQRHLPALKKIGFQGAIEAFDLIPTKNESGVKVQSIQDAKPSSADLSVVCTPGPVHVESIEKLQSVNGPILVEKPLCYSRKEFDKFLKFARARKEPLFVCHSARYMHNTLMMLRHLSKYNSGKLHHVSVNFQVEAVKRDIVPWLRKERKTRTLLMDYGLHLLDLACLFAEGSPRLDRCRYELNGQGETSLIEGTASFDNYTINFILRQGINPRKSRLTYVFQNYSVNLAMAPERFAPQMADDNFGLSWLETWQGLKGTTVKVAERLLRKNREHSHAYVLQGALTGNMNHPLQLDRLQSFYDLLFQISDKVYKN